MIDVDRHISFFEKKGDKFIGEIIINEIELAVLLDLISVNTYKDDCLLYGCYLLDKEQLNRIFLIINNPIQYDLDKYDYFLGATSK